MKSLQNKIDFAVIISVINANPNGDPLNGNRPRTDYAGIGEISDVCLKRKIRNILMERFVNADEAERAGKAVFVQSADRRVDDAKSLKERAELLLGKKMGTEEMTQAACEAWFDVRAFGQLFAYSKKGGKKGKDDGDDGEGDSGVSVGIRGPVTIQSAYSVDPVEVVNSQITKSVNSEGDGSSRGSDTMGMKYRVAKGIYVTFGSISPQLAERTGFSDGDADVLKDVLVRLFEGDASSARPDGSMEVLKVFWWKHNQKYGQYSSAKVHKSLKVASDGTFELQDLDGLVPEIIDGF